MPTNVVKVAQTIQRRCAGTDQLMYYDPGVGTEGSLLRRLWDGATGSGLVKNLLDAYQWLVRNYEPGDQLFFLGFSRGAFTVRSLAGFVRNSGILRRDCLHVLQQAFGLYRSRNKRTHPRAREAVLFRRTYAVEERTPIEFIGVWDTVGTLGNPLLFRGLSPGNRFHDTDLSSTVRHAFQALAIDEKRWHFKATRWTRQAPVPEQLLEQVWFVGCHSNIGGGLPLTGLSDIALQWLVDRADACGLGIDRVGWNPASLESVTESRTGLYRLIPVHIRPIDAPSKGGPTNESLHPSVLDRYRQDRSYRPPNLERYLDQNPQLRPVL